MKEDTKLLEAKINDQYQFAISKNKITHTDFLNQVQKRLAEKFLQENKIQNYMFFGGNGQDSERNILLFFPEKFSHEMVIKNYEKILSVLKIHLPRELEYEHRIYLSGLMKLGIKREKVGDILDYPNGADIIVLNEVADFLENSLPELTRFKSAKIERISIFDVQPKLQEFEEFSIIVSSMRLDNFVAELARTSRTKAAEIMNEQRVLVNYEIEMKASRKIATNDVINVRGKGKFIVGEIERQTRSEKLVVQIKKYKS